MRHKYSKGNWLEAKKMDFEKLLSTKGEDLKAQERVRI